MTITTAGFDRIRAGLDSAIAVGVERAADRIVDTAQGLVPVDTGALRDSIRAEPVAPTHWQVIAGGGDVDYAIFVEYGTSKMAAQPFLTPASRQVDVAAEIEAELRKLIG
jgi:HK97 gp10 family phage protein